MTFSLLVRDPETGALGGAAATGSLCVGGWVLRGDSRAGLSASQGAAPSTFWGEDVLALMRSGQGAAEAVPAVTAPDGGQEWRQLSALDRDGGTGVFTGVRNTGWRGALERSSLVVAGNLLAGEQVLHALADGFARAEGDLALRLIAALKAADTAGGDSRGLQSAALLVVAADSAPLTLRIDWSEDPLAALEVLHDRTREPDYAAWFRTVPTLADPERGHG